MNFHKIVKFKKTESEDIANIILEANNNTIIAQIGKKFIVNIFLKRCMCSKYINIFVVKNVESIFFIFTFTIYKKCHFKFNWKNYFTLTFLIWKLKLK